MNFFKNIYNNYFCVNLKDYDKIAIDLEINKILFFVFLGLCAATVIISVINMNTSLILKKLLRLEVFSQDKAKTLGDLGLDKNFVVKHLLSKQSGQLLSVITLVGYEKPSYDDYVSYEKNKHKNRFKPKEAQKTINLGKEPSLTPDFGVVSLYITEEKKDAAELIFKRNSTSVLKTVLSCVIIMAFYTAVLFLMPGILSLINAIIS